MTQINKSIFDQLLDPNSKTMAFIWLNEPGWPIKDCSSSAIRRLGLDPEQVKSQSIHYAELIHPDDIGRVAEVVNAALEGKTKGESQVLGYRLRSHNNDWVWVESDSVQKVLSDDEKPVIGFVFDVSDRYKTEEALRKNEDRLELVLESANMGMWDWNPQTNEVICDARWAGQIGLTLDELTLDLSVWSSRVHPDDLDDCLKAVKDHLEEKTEFFENVHRLKHKDGHWVYILDRGKVFERDAQNRPIKFIGTHTDITPLKLAEVDAIAALNARDRFFSSMSHELRTPLHAILGVAELLEQEMSDESHKQKISLVRESSEYLLNVLKDILDVAKMEEGELHLVITQFSIVEVIEQVVQLFSSRAEQKGLDLKVDVQGGIVTGLETDRTRLTQILANLVSNAIKYTDSGSVKIKVKEQLGDLYVSINDTGCGINNVDEIFEPFKQERNRQIDDVHTTGLGLTIVKKLCERLNVVLDVTSTPNQGSSFRITLPGQFRLNDFKRPLSKTTVVDPNQWPELSVLIVDDNKVNRVVARAMLQRNNVHVREASNGEEAVEIIKNESFDVVCLDLHMPKLGGIKATQKIRAMTLPKPIQIIGMSADAFPETIKECMSAGMDEYLTKPFKQRDLLEVINRVLSL
jgi:PAS domain S-box-containing protein